MNFTNRVNGQVSEQMFMRLLHRHELKCSQVQSPAIPCGIPKGLTFVTSCF